MDSIARRRFLQLAGLVAGGALVGCDTAAPQSGATSGATGTLRWWDQFEPIAKFEKQLFAEFGKSEGGLPVEYTTQNPENMARSLQLAFQSKQMPDVFTLAGIDLPTSGLKEQGWFAPLELDDAHRKMLPEGTLIEGLNMFDGKPYAFPLFSYRSHDTLTWFNKDLFAKASLDPAKPPRTYDEIRAAARAIKSSGGDGVSGWIAPLKLVQRLQSQISQLAQVAGSGTGSGNTVGVDLRTGEYAFHGEHFVNAIEFWIAMKTDGVLFPASTSLDARTARARWATGTSGFFFDGSYNIGVLNGGFKQFVDKVGVGAIPVPEATSPGTLAGNAANAAVSLWVSAQSKNIATASRLVAKFAELEVQAGVAGAMDQPPLVSAALTDAEVHETFTTAVEHFNKAVFRGPSPEVRNPGVSAVTKAIKPPEPGLGQIVAAAVSGELPDWKGALKKLSDGQNAARETAIKAAKGAKVSAADWAFPDWQPGKDYDVKPR